MRSMRLVFIAHLLDLVRVNISRFTLTSLTFNILCQCDFTYLLGSFGKRKNDILFFALFLPQFKAEHQVVPVFRFFFNGGSLSIIYFCKKIMATLYSSFCFRL